MCFSIIDALAGTEVDGDRAPLMDTNEYTTSFCLFVFVFL